MAQWYQKQTSTPTAADRLNFLRQYREEKAAQNSLRNAGAYQPTQSTGDPTTSASGLLPLSGGGNAALAGQAVPQQTGDTAGRYTLEPVAGVSRMQSGSPEQAQQTAVPPSTNIVPLDKLQNISDSDLDNPDTVLYVLNARDKNTEASFPSWAYTAAKRIIQLFDPAWSPERQIADMTPEQRKQEALNYLNQIRASVNFPGNKLKEAIPDNVNQTIEAFGSGLMNTLSWGMLDNQHFREAGEKDPAARFLGETLGAIAPAARVGKDLASQDFGTAENPEKLALEEAWAKEASAKSKVADSRRRSYTNGNDEAGLPDTGEIDTSQLTRAQRRNVDTLKNIVSNNLKDSDFSGTAADLQGEPIPNGNDGFFDHLTEMRQSYTGLKRIKSGLKGSLQNPNLSSEVRSYLQENLDKTGYYLKKIEDLFKPFGGIE